MEGGIVNKDLSITPCFVVKEQNYFAHGNSLKEAIKSLNNKLLLKLPIEERIENFIKEFNLNNKYKVELFYNWHFLLTGSCVIGRNSFMKNNNISLIEAVKDWRID
jgi:hypothetical protein